MSTVPPLPDTPSAAPCPAPALLALCPQDTQRQTTLSCAPDQWQQLPARGARVAAIAGAIGMALTLAAITVPLSLLLNHSHGWLWKLPLALGCGALLGAWASWRRHRRTGWRLDDHSLAVRRQHLWYSDTRVPRARVQHLDVRRGPLERSLGLATLVVHTAGSRLEAVSLSGLELADAETLRELLARPDDHDGL